MSTRVVNATAFKAHCLALLDEVEQTGESITITKRGRPVAVVGPSKKKAWKSPAGSWAGRAQIVGDIVSPPPAEIWDYLREERE
jgi:prevent-host-death family protein